MLMVLSPAKNLQISAQVSDPSLTDPQFLSQSAILVEQLAAMSPAQLSSLMHISDALGVLNYDRYQAWSLPLAEDTPAAVLTFNGDVYTGLDAASLTAEQLHWSNDHLRILSGLYGVLRPLDRMLPYRLEMGTKLQNTRGKDLYAFWGAQIAESLKEQMNALQTNTLINLASNEYFKAVDKKALGARIVTPHFKDLKNGQYKIISFYAKKARGLMARYVIQQGIDQPESLKGFDLAGYSWNSALSKGDNWVFTRDEPVSS